MAIDASRFAEVTHHLHLLWSGMHLLVRVCPDLPLCSRPIAACSRSYSTLSTYAMVHSTWYYPTGHLDSS